MIALPKASKIVLAVVIVIILFFMVMAFIKGPPDKANSTKAKTRANQEAADPLNRHTQPQSSPAVFYEQDAVTFEHFWPLDAAAQHLKADESEIVVHNRGNQTVEFSSVGMDYFIGGSQMPHYSGTWEKFPDDVSWEKIDYINISPQHYKGEKLSLQPGQKCKIHYHYQVGQGQGQNPDQKVKLNLAFTIGGSPYKLDQELVRSEPPREATESETEHNTKTSQPSQGH